MPSAFAMHKGWKDSPALGAAKVIQGHAASECTEQLNATSSKGQDATALVLSLKEGN